MAAVRHGARIVEVDVRQSRDGILLCHHDASIEGLGTIADVDLADVDVFTLEQFLDDLDAEDPARTVVIHYDLKATGYELPAVDAVVARGRPLFVTTGEQTSVALLRRARPDVDTYLTIGSSVAGMGTLEAIRHRLGELFPTRTLARLDPQGIAIHHQLCWWRTRRWCAKHGLAVVVWTVDADDALERWLRRPVDVVTTNRPLAAKAILSRTA